jgi:hypothetical protein
VGEDGAKQKRKIGDLCKSQQHTEKEKRAAEARDSLSLALAVLSAQFAQLHLIQRHVIAQVIGFLRVRLLQSRYLSLQSSDLLCVCTHPTQTQSIHNQHHSKKQINKK